MCACVPVATCACMWACVRTRVCVGVFCASTQTYSISAFEQEWCASFKEAGGAWEEGPGWLAGGWDPSMSPQFQKARGIWGSCSACPAEGQPPSA